MRSPIRLFIALAVLLAASVVAAQVYKWVDKDGKVQYSDTPPPDTKAEARKVDVKPASGTAATAPPKATTKSLQERAKEFDKRKNEGADKAKKAEEEEKNAQLYRENCESAQSFLRDLESGRPVNRTTSTGERAFMSDEERAAEMAKARKTISENCK
jgi:hypothetical protein